jgi:hypothetical protein
LNFLNYLKSKHHSRNWQPWPKLDRLVIETYFSCKHSFEILQKIWASFLYNRM